MGFPVPGTCYNEPALKKSMTLLMSPKQAARVAGVEGPWVDPDIDSGLVAKCKRCCNTPSPSRKKP